MNQKTAPLFLKAAWGDPILAAWASVIYAYDSTPSCDVSPYDHLEAFEELVRFGVVSVEEYNKTDIKRCFFSGKRPSMGSVQCTLDAYRSFIVERHLRETKEIMSRKDLQVFQNSQSLSRTKDNELGSGPSMDELSLFEEPSKALAHAPQEAVSVFENSSAPPTLPYDDQTRATRHELYSSMEPRPRIPSIPRDSDDIDAELLCCGVPLEYKLDDQADTVSEEMGEPLSMKEYVFHARCTECGAFWHFSVARPFPPDAIP